MRRHRRGDEDDEAEPFEAGATRKRLRVSKACSQCRRRKDRCDGQQPCGSCASASRDCIYDPAKKRGLPPGYVRAVEMLMGLVLRCVPDSERFMQETLQRSIMEPVSASKSGAMPSDTLLNVWRSSPVFKNFEKLLVQAEPGDNEDASASSLEDRLAFTLSVAAANLALTPSASAIPNVAASNEAELHLPANWSDLIDIYSATTHCWFPISQQHDLLRSANIITSCTDHRAKDDLNSGDLAFLWAVFAYTSHRPANLIPNTPHLSQNDNEDISSAQRFDHVTLSLIPPDVAKHTLGHVRALLLLALLRVSQGSWSSAWVLVGQAIYAAGNLGIVPPSGVSSDSGLDDGQKRVFLGCFVLETMIASHFGRRTYLTRSDQQTVGHLQTDGMEEWDAWKPAASLSVCFPSAIFARQHIPGRVLSTFNTFTDLMGVLNEIHSTPVQELNSGRHHNISQCLDQYSCRLSPQCCQAFKTEPIPISPQLLNVSIAAAIVSATLRNKTVNTPRASLSPGQQHEFHEILDAMKPLQEHLSGFCSAWMPPFLDSYLQTLDRYFSSQSGIHTTDWVSLRDNVKAAFEKTRCDPHSNQPAPHAPVQPSSLPNNQVLSSPSAQEDFSTFSLSMPQYSPQREISARYKDAKNVNTHQSSQTRQLVISQTPNRNIDPIRTHEAIELPDTADLPSGHPDHDSLFDGLAMFDSIDWMADAPQFLERLGMAHDFDFNDFESLFSHG